MGALISLLDNLNGCINFGTVSTRALNVLMLRCIE